MPALAKIIQNLISRAEDKFGKQRTEDLRPDIEQVAADLKELSAAPIEFDDES